MKHLAWIRTVLAVAATILVVGAASAGAAKMITGADVRNGSLTGADIKNGSLRTRDLATSIRR